MRQSILLFTALSLCGVLSAEEYHVHTFETFRLSDVFFGEGAHFGDFDRDGVGDVVSGPFWYAGPHFRDRHEFYPVTSFSKNGYSNNFFTWVDDVNRDGWDDVLVVGFPGADLSWFENSREEPGHWTRHQVFDGVDNESPHYVDLTGDGRRELVFHTQGQWGWAAPDPQDPAKPWKFHAVAPPGNYQRFTHGMGVGDIDGDGRQDILERGGWWQHPASDSEGGFWKKHAYDFAPHGYGGAQMFAYDFDGDGDNDVVAAPQAHGHGLYWFEQVPGDGEISFVPHAIMDPQAGSAPEASKYAVSFSQPHAMDLVDMDGDGVKDLVTGKRYWAHNGHDTDSRSPAVLYWFKTVRGEEGTEFVPFLIHGDSGVGTQVVAGDVNGDGLVDVVVGNKAGTWVHIHGRRRTDRSEYLASWPRPYGRAVERLGESGSSSPRNAARIPPLGDDGKPLNLGLETGSLEDWVADGDAFRKMPVKGDATLVKRRKQRAGHEGEYWAGGYEIDEDPPQGTLTSVPFRVTHPWASFLVGGGHHESTCVEVVQADDQKLLVRASGRDLEPMRRRIVDLREIVGKKIFVRLVDRHTGHWGHINYDDFVFHDTKPRFAPDALALVPDEYPHAGLSPEESPRRMTLPHGFRATLFAGEPDVQQPVAFAIDDRGRLWIAEAYSYPVRRPDSEARDRLLIFEDEDGDGRFDRRTVFQEGLNLVSGLEVDFGGVWVGAAPYLLFIPDRDGDDVPDAKPEVLLDGWGYQDTHETLNSFIWGPDGWLYGCHGVFTHSRVGKPGTPEAERQKINAGIWRYHPIRHEFEVFCRGTSNPWGIDWNDRGQAFVTACVIPHLYHAIQGARYERQGGRHFNPHLYDDIKTIADHRHYLGPNPHGGNHRSSNAGGGHAHCGAMVYLGDAWPATYRGRVFMNNIHGQRINVDVPVERGSGYVGYHAPDFLLTNDSWSQGINLRYGPDGQVYWIDWYDQNACHHRRVDAHDRSNGRIYKVTYGEPRRVQVNLRLLADSRLAELQLHENDWYVRHARRVLQERARERKLQPSAVTKLREIALGHSHEHRRLRGLWALHAASLLTEDVAAKALRDYSPFVRAWAVQLILEDRNLSEASLARFVEMARKDRSQVVRLYLASGLPRLPPARRWEILAGLLAHPEDASDPNLPLMYWYAGEPLAEVDPRRSLDLALQSKVPLFLAHMVRRIASLDGDEALNPLVEALGASGDDARQREFLRGIRAALRGRRQVPMPGSWPAVYAKLGGSADSDLRADLDALAVVFGDPRAFQAMHDVLADRRADSEQREKALESLLAAKDERLAPTLRGILDDPPLRAAAIRALAAYHDPEIPGAILNVYDSLRLSEKRDALTTLSSRPAFARALLDAVGEQKVPGRDLTAEIIRQLRALKSDDVAKRLEEVWGIARSVDGDKARLIARYTKLLRQKPRGGADVTLGRAVFARTCQQCHTLFGAGGKVGPDLTGSNRADRDYILSNVLDPSAVLAKEYMPYVFVTKDGRFITGLILEETGTAYTVATANDTVVLAKGDVADRQQSTRSMMPDDLLAALSEDEVQALIAYLASPGQVLMKATADSAGLLFNGKDLGGWVGNPELWSVENGEIVGRSPGIRRNEFLRSELLVEDFQLRLRVKLTPDSGNSGIQFRSEALPGGEVKGYQADVGKGWWGKLYEEHGRALLWKESGERHVRVGEWNDYEIVARGSRIRTSINGKLCVDLDDPDGARRGIIALQIHSGPAMEVRFKDLRLEVLGDSE
ncbi:MAG: DUF1080 domain-containing protein [Planctomycetota bacterium]|nr:DUF1080 domain-containing protein [Planctomycetota bacterium]